jgi:hypothetical protein
MNVLSGRGSRVTCCIMIHDALSTTCPQRKSSAHPRVLLHLHELVVLLKAVARSQSSEAQGPPSVMKPPRGRVYVLILQK